MSNLRNALSRTGVFTVPVAGLYLLSLHLCSQDRKKVEPHQHLARLICPKHCVHWRQFLRLTKSCRCSCP